nr:hypothetical protein [uncultured Glaciecola sp.]
MNSQLHQTTLSLISLIQVYQQTSGDNEKIRCAVTYSKLLKQKGIETSSVKEKLRFCSEAVEAISSVVVESKFKLTKTESITPLLDRDEIDFIHEMMLSENEGESNEGNNQSKMDLYGT